MYARGLLRLAPEEAPKEAVSEALAAFGLQFQGDLPDDEEFYLWPENVPLFHVWLRLQTQWVRKAGNDQLVGLNYGGVESCFRLCGIRRADWSDYFHQVQAMESAVLTDANSA